MSANPFSFGNPIRQPERFYDRSSEIRQITSRLLSSAHESTSIVGERRMGKTSLLKHLDNLQVAQGLGFNAGQYCLVYIDFQGLTDISPQRFWERVLKKIRQSVCQAELIPQIDALLGLDSYDLFDLEDLFDQIAAAGITIVLLLDEFEHITQNPNFSPNFFGGLRSLAIHQNLALITATRRELVDLCHSDEIKGSPFFNIFASVVLRPFNMADTQTLVDGYLAYAGLSPSQASKDLVCRMGGGHPFLVQIAGYYLVEGMQEAKEGTDLHQYIISQFDQQSAPHFQYYWSKCTESEKIALLSVISLNRQKPGHKTLPTLENLSRIQARAPLDVPELVQRGLLVMDVREQFHLLSPSLERWILREITAVPGSEENQASVESWIKAGGREDFEPVKGMLPKFKKQYWPIVASVMQDISLNLVGSAAFELLMRSVV
jgi:AAA+ ATPase superfamily predicted ATPase